MTTPTLNDVLDAFDALGGPMEQPKALCAALEKRGFSADQVVIAINEAIKVGALKQTDRGAVYRG